MEPLPMKRVLVTGGAGFIGSCFVRAARTSEREVIVLDALTYAGSLSNLSNIDPTNGCTFVKGSINERDLVASLLDLHKPDSIVNFAAETHVDRSIDQPPAFVETNVSGVIELLEAALSYWRALPPQGRDTFRFVQISTDEVFGSITSGCFTEESAYAPNSPYAASKAAADHLVRSYWRTYGLPTMIALPSNTFGPRQFPEKLIPYIVINALSERALPVYGDGQQVRDWIHVKDHCSAAMRILDAGRAGESYCISARVGEKDGLTNLRVVQSICRLLDTLRPRPRGQSYAALIEFVEDRPGHDRRYAVDPTKIEKMLGWQPRFTFDTGLENTVRWYLANRSWWKPLLDAGYGADRIGLGRRVG